MNYAKHLSDPVFHNEVVLEICRLWSIHPVEQRKWAIKRVDGFHTHVGIDCQLAIRTVYGKFPHLLDE